MGARNYGIANPTFQSVAVILAVACAAFPITILIPADSNTWAAYISPTRPLSPSAFVVHRGSPGWIRVQGEEIAIVPSWFRAGSGAMRVRTHDSILGPSFSSVGALPIAPLMGSSSSRVPVPELTKTCGAPPTWQPAMAVDGGPELQRESAQHTI